MEAIEGSAQKQCQLGCHQLMGVNIWLIMLDVL